MGRGGRGGGRRGGGGRHGGGGHGGGHWHHGGGWGWGHRRGMHMFYAGFLTAHLYNGREVVSGMSPLTVIQQRGTNICCAMSFYICISALIATVVTLILISSSAIPLQ